MKFTITEQLLYAIEQRIGKIYSYKVIHDVESPSIQDPYLFYVSRSNGKFVRYTVECFRSVPLRYTSKSGFIIDFDVMTDNVHSVLYGIIDTEMKQANYSEVVEGVLTFESGQTQRFELNLQEPTDG